MPNDLFMLFLVVCSGAFLWSIVNVIKKHFLDKHKVHEDVMTVGLMLSASIFCYIAEFLINGTPKIESGFWTAFLITGTLNIFIQYWGVKAFKYEDASIIAPLSGSMPLFLIFTSWIILKEFPTKFGLIGIILIAFGSYILYLKGSKVELPNKIKNNLNKKYHNSFKFWLAPWLRLFSSKGARLALYTALLGAIAVNFDKIAIFNSSPFFYSGSFLLVVGIFIYLWSKLSGRWDNLDKAYLPKICFLGLLLGLVTVLMNSGYLFGIVPYVGALRRTQILWTVIFASIFLKEKNSITRLIGAIIIFIGVIFIAF